MGKTNSVKWLIIFLMAIWSLLILGESMVSQKLHVDEGVYISRGWAFYKFLDRNDPLWKTEAAYDQPLGAMYLYGWWLKKESDGEARFFPNLCRSWSICKLHLPNANDNLFLIDSENGVVQMVVLKARVLSVVSTWLLVILLFAISIFILERWWVGVMWVGLLLSNKVFVFEMTRAKPDSFLILSIFSFITLLTVWIKRRLYRDRVVALLWMVGLGIVGGLATSIKLNGVMCFALLIPVSLVLLWQKKINIRRLMGLMLVTIVIGWGTFVLLNPYTWSKPLARSADFFTHLIKVTDNLEVELKDRYYLGDWQERFPMVYHVLFEKKETGLLAFGNRAQIQIMVMLSLLIFLAKIWREKALHRKTFYLMLLVIGLINYSYLSLDWYRYYLPLMVVMAFIFTNSLVELIDGIWYLMKRRGDDH